MARPFEFSVFIGRFQPFHNAHRILIQEALKQADTAIVVIGSYKRAPSPKNPWTGEEREAMIRASLSKEENERVKIILMRDYLYLDNMWLANLTQRVAEIVGESESIVLIGHPHDHSSYYLNLFPQWKRHLLPNIDQFPHASKIREAYFTYDIAYKNSLAPPTISCLESFKQTPKFKSIKAYFDAIQSGKEEWAGSPHHVIFHTVDTVVIKSGHVLCVRRGKAYGGGQLALPGGFLESDERLLSGALRELKEETSIAISREELEKAVKVDKNFDDPDRSERGRTITTAFFLDLGRGLLPRVKGGDDADKSFWLPLNELFAREEEFFEDHYHIIQYFVGSPMLKC